MHLMLYRWEVHPEHRESFIAAWSAVTEWIATHCDSLGSRLHEGPANVFTAYAQWPDLDTFNKSREIAAPPHIASALQRMNDAAASPITRQALTLVDDQLIHKSEG